LIPVHCTLQCSTCALRRCIAEAYDRMRQRGGGGRGNIPLTDWSRSSAAGDRWSIRLFPKSDHTPKRDCRIQCRPDQGTHRGLLGRWYTSSSSKTSVGRAALSLPAVASHHHEMTIRALPIREHRIVRQERWAVASCTLLGPRPGTTADPHAAGASSADPVEEIAEVSVRHQVPWEIARSNAARTVSTVS
jgi:hypothetical protein